MASLLLIRHAIAEPRGEAWPDDRLRPLTAKGETRMREIAARLHALGESADIILASPLTRAMQTARIISEEWPGTDVEVCEALAPGRGPADVLAAVAARAHGPVAIVGHEPGLGQFAAWLIGARHPLPFKKGGAARIEVETFARPSRSHLVWLATPKMLRAGD